ncbi:MAG: PKD domain-containing protein [Bacteroidetes bacterium]|nr:PKD domain-containing protein [Bacteroidota bacterium]
MTFAFADATVNSTSWSWDFGDTQTSTLQNPTHVYATIGTYTVTLVASNGCGTDTSIIIIAVDGIENIPFANSVNVYPNPTNGQFNVLFNNNNNSVVSIQLYNLEGKLMQQKQINNVKAGTSVQINVEGYATGMYMLKLLGDNGTAVFKVDVQ